MSDKINIPAILAKHMTQKGDSDEENIAAIKEIVEAVIDKCDEKLHCTQENLDKDMKLSESILNIKKEIKYE